MDFPGFLGNAPVKAALSAAFQAGRFPHAVLLQGEAGTGKRTLAGLIAQALVCRNRDRAPCGTCPSCIRAAAGSHPDIRVIQPAGSARSLTVEAIREVTEDAGKMPEEAEVNVYILVLGSRPSEAAQNKLLKVIEEPPMGTVFLLVAESAELLLPTIRSRVQTYTLLPPSEAEAASFVAEKTGIPPEEAGRLAALCGGNIGRMLAESSPENAAKSLTIAAQIAGEMLSTGGDGMLRAFAPLQRDRALCREVLVRLGAIFRDACVLRAGGDTLLGGAPEVARRLQRLPLKQLAALPELTREYIRKVDGNANMALLTVCLCAALREAAGTQ